MKTCLSCGLINEDVVEKCPCGISFVQSNSSTNIWYQVDVRNLTCTCKDFSMNRIRHQTNNPERLCKHIASIVLKEGILPKDLEPFKDQIQRFLEETDKKLPGDKRPSLLKSDIKILSVEKRIKYCELHAKCDSYNVDALINLKDIGDILYSINSHRSHFNIDTENTGVYKIPRKYLYVLVPTISWIIDECNKVLNNKFHEDKIHKFLNKLHEDIESIRSKPTERREKREEFTITIGLSEKDLKELQRYLDDYNELKDKK